MKRIFTNLFVAVLLMLSTTSWAQFTNGKVYRIVCSGSPSVSLGASALSDVAALSTSETDRAQQWYVTGSNGKYTFRNLANGRYLLGHKDYSNEWRLTEESNEFTVDQVNGNYAIYQTSHGTYYTYMHKDGSNNIVSWESSAANSQWTPYEVSYTAAELQAIWNEVESFILTEDAVKGYEEKLMAIFTDKACTQLNSTYASKSVSQIEADANYQALPAVLQAMVLKVKNNDWSEANAVSSKPQWGSDYAKKFRVQMYEPYSIEGEITSYLRINAHCNMDNPTGLYANSGKAMYIMVEGEIKEGAELWVAYQTGLGATNYYNNASYTQLREGLNVVPYFYDTSSLWINYVVHTYNANGATNAEKFPHKLSDYKPLKIHIEGGHINGYYNAIGDFRAADSGTENLWGDVDNDDDWNYYMERAPLDGNDGRPNRDFPLLAHRQTLLFPLAPVVDDGGVTRAGLYHRIANIEVPSVPNCYGGSGNTFGTFDGSYPGMGLSTSNGKINIMLEAWDRIMYSQLASMGVVSKSTMDKMNALYPRWTSAGTTAEIYDYNNKSSLDNKTYLEFCNGIDYSEYFNHHGCGVGWPNGYMSGGWRVTAYHYETMEGIIGTMASSSGSTWGPAHEIGHQHQSIINLEGQTEVTNNLFSNIAVWYMGMATSRYDGSQGSLESVLGAFTTEGSDLYANNIWALTHLYYRLWLYYHLAGNNTQFWPRLFELCRQVPLENHPNGTNDGSTTLLRFYQHACDAAGEDLTEFFRAHGYFEVMDNRVVGDYYGATYNQTQAQIDAAIQSVKAKNYPANYAVLLINDGTSETTFKHNGKTRRGLWDGYATAEFGSVNDFISGDADVTTNYEARLDSDGSITMSGGEGGIGFLMFNEDGELVAFSNKSTFKLGKEAKELYQNGQARIVVVNADNEIIGLGEEIVPEPEDPAISAKKAELQALIDATRGLVATVADVSAAVDAAVDLRGKLHAERPYTAGGTNHSDYSSVENNYNLLDNSVDTHFHSDYNYSTMVSPPYIRVDLGEGESAAKFKFNYTTRNASDCAPTKINVYAGNEQTLNGTPIATFTINDSENPLPTATSTSWTSRDIECGTACRYFKFEVVESQGSKTENGVKKYYFVMSEFGFNKVSDAVITIKDEYKDSKVTEELLVATNNAVVDAQKVKDKTSSSIALLEAQIAALQAAKTALEEAMQETDNSASASKAELLGLMGVAQGLYQEIADETNGVVEDYYTTVLTQADIDELITVMRNAGTVHESSTATADEITVAYNELNAVYERLKAVQEANAGDRTALQQLINDVKAMYEPMAVETAKTIAIPLQATNAGEAYYIWCNAPAGDSNGVAGLIDKNADGSANTGTFLGTDWGADVPAYTHYVEIDLGAGTTIGELSIDYTTRNTTHADQRPNAIKILGSNDKANYTKITEITSGLAANANEKWSMGELLDLGGRYRYIRIAVGSERGFFHMADFNLYASLSNSLDEYYSTAEGLEFDALTLALETAEYAVGHYVTEAQYNAILDNLRSCYNVTKSVAEADYTDRDALTELLDDATTLVNDVVTVNKTATSIALQATDVNAPYYIYCNAPGATNDYEGDNLGVAALLDVDGNGNPNTATFLHTSYVDGSHDDDLDHYLRVDMGESNLLSFKFGYTERIGNTGNAPLVMLIEGSNDCVNFEEITTLSDMATTYQSDEITNGKAYRYIRFMVKDTHNHSAHNGHPFFAMSHFEMTACKTITISDEYASQNLSVGVVADAYNELVDAGTVISHYATNDAVTEAEEELQAAYDALVATITTMDKEPLKELIDATTLLKNSLYEIAVTSYTATDVALQSTDEAAAGYLYCNAPETNSPWASDNIGVGAAIDLTAGGDPNLDTFLHTEYGNDPSADGLDHYLRVDLGAEGATAYIEFGYVGRSGHETKSPETAIVEATNDLNGEWTTIKTLNLAQPSATAETKTGALGNGVAYRYWRFMVTDTHFDGYDGQGNHKFFALSDFNVYKCTDIVISSKLNNEYNPDIYIYTTTELVAEVEDAIASATQVYKNALSTVEDYNNAVEALQAEYDKLAEAIRYHDVPVRITTDENNPVLYKIISKRADDGSKVLRFDEPASNNVTIVDAEANASYQAWYFVKGNDGYIIKPFNGQGNMLGVEDTSDGSAKALITAGPAYVEWTFARSAVEGCTDYYYIYVNGTSHACLSHNGGFNLTTKLGIWAGGWNTDDGGSLFKFVDAEFENDNAHYYQLCDFAGALETMTAATPQGTVVGAYEYGDAYDEALDAATTLREAGNTSDAAACRDAYTALRAAYKDIKQILPVEGKYYRIDLTPGMSEDDARRGASMRIDDNAKLECGEYDASNARFYFTFEYDDDGNLYMKNLHTGTYLDEANAHNSDVQVGADAEAITDAKLITIKTLGTTSGGAVVVGIVPTGGAMLNCTAKTGAVKAWDNADVNKTSAWVISEVEDLSQIAHTVTMSATFSSVMLGYNATVPEGVEAYNAEGVDGGYVSLVEVARAGEVIPANTPVILYRTDDTKEKIFTYTENDATNIPYETVLGGSLFQKYVKCEENMDYYKLMIQGGEAKMYWMYKEFDAAGNKVGENNGGHIKCSANKIYMALPSQQQAASYSMRFKEPETTGAEEVKTENGEVKTIYDLQGRKLTEITQPGFYIVNGKKVYVK